MKNIFKSLFGKPSVENQTKSNLEQVPLYSSKHPAFKEILQIEEKSEKTIKFEVTGSSTLTTYNSGDYLQLIELFNQAIAKAPGDPDLLYARSGLHFLALQGEDGQKDRDSVLKISPNHFDAFMNKEHFKTWDSLFQLPCWDEKKTVLTDLMKKHIESEHYAQVVRDHLRGAVAIVVPENPNIGIEGCSKIRWDLKWISTPHGKIAAHYLFLNNGKFQEMFMPHLTGSDPSINSNFWLLKRLVLENYCFIVIVRNSKVIWNERFIFPPVLLKTLSQMGIDLKKDGAISSMDKFQTAAQWYMNNSDVSTLKY
jgi:hypothetical protein